MHGTHVRTYATEKVDPGAAVEALECTGGAGFTIGYHGNLYQALPHGAAEPLEAPTPDELARQMHACASPW